MRKLPQEMYEIAERLTPGFVTADAEYPDFSLADGTLKLEFTDHASERITVQFANAIAVNWQELSATSPNPRDDEIYEIKNSSWIADHIRQGARSADEELRHFRLCFNACGTLDVIAATMELSRT